MIAVDLDATLNNLLDAWLDYVNKKNNTNYQVHDIKHYSPDILINNFEFILLPDLYDNVTIIDGAIDFVKALSKLDDVKIVTHTFNEHKESKRKFIKHFFGDIKVDYTGDCKLAYTENCLLIDDKLEHIVKHNEAGYQGIVYSNHDRYQYNLTDSHIRMGCYDEIIEHIKKNI